MATKYSVVQYVPDPLAGERINIGMIAVGYGRVAMRFLDSWHRVEHFAAGRDIRFLRDFIEDIEVASAGQLGLEGLHLSENLSADSLEEMSRRWTNALQFTQPAASLRTPDQVLQALAPRFLTAAPPSEQRNPQGRLRTRRTAAAIGYNALSIAINREQAEARVLRREWVRGAHEAFQFDAVAANGVPILATQGMSLETLKEDEVDQAANAVAMGVRDVREGQPQVQFAVVLLYRAEHEHTRGYQRAVNLFTNLGAEVVASADAAQDWALSAYGAYLDGKVKDEQEALI